MIQDRMTPAQLCAEILEKAEKVKSLPWTLDNSEYYYGTAVKGLLAYEEGCVGDVDFKREDDANYISSANPTNIKSLLSLMQEMAEALEELNAEETFMSEKMQELLVKWKGEK